MSKIPKTEKEKLERWFEKEYEKINLAAEKTSNGFDGPCSVKRKELWREYNRRLSILIDKYESA